MVNNEQVFMMKLSSRLFVGAPLFFENPSMGDGKPIGYAIEMKMDDGSKYMVVSVAMINSHFIKLGNL